MPRNWYGNARSARTAPRTHNGALWLNSVGGTNGRSTMASYNTDPQTCRAIYGSTDNASGDYANSILCRAITPAQASALHTVRHYDGPSYGHNVHRYAPSNGPVITDPNAIAPTSSEQDSAAPSDADIAWLIKRATARGMTLAEYCQKIGIPLS